VRRSPDVLHRRTRPRPRVVSGPVYPPREDTQLLGPFAAAAKPGERVLEVGTGSGELAARAAATGAYVVATDLNRSALESARAGGASVEVLLTDLAGGTRRFHRILANPPYLPTPRGSPGEEPADRLALDGGPDGCRVTARLLRELPPHLLPGGALYLLFSSLQDPKRIARLFATWRRRVGPVRRVAERRLEGEWLWVVELRNASARARRARVAVGAGAASGARRTAGPRAPPRPAGRAPLAPRTSPRKRR
jgi:release factor glutamine methyltransferase